MSGIEKNKKKPFNARQFEDILGKLRTENTTTTEGESKAKNLDGPRLAELLERHFNQIDPNNNGITKEELAQAMLMPQKYSEDEYAMLELLGFYFDTCANLVDDQWGEETVISRSDKSVLVQFLRHGNLTLDELHRWRQLAKDEERL